MLIPSIDLMSGKVVQLVRGERKALEFEDVGEWIERFRHYPMVQVIDLDAAMGNGTNAKLIERICGELTCQVGGGIRTPDIATQVIARGANKAIIGTALFSHGRVDTKVASDFAEHVSCEQLIFSLDSRGGKVAIKGWKESTSSTPEQMMQETAPYCGGFLYTHIDTEGTMQGFPLDVAERLALITERKLIVAGGIRSRNEVDRLDSLGIDAVVGMAVYTGTLQS